MPNIECFICAGSGVMFNPDCGEMLCRCTTDEITRLTAELAYAKKGEARLRESAERLRAMITSLTAELAHTDARVRALGAWKIAAIEILFRLHINEAADGQDIDDARGLLDREE